MFRIIPIGGKLVRSTDEQSIALECEGLGGFEPGAKRLFRKLLPSAVEEAGPNFARGKRH